jgi:hypothetical protein
MAAEESKAHLDELRKHLTAKEREALDAAQSTAAAWKPLADDEFMASWFKPLDLLDVSDPRLADDADKWEIVEQLRAGQINAVARTAQTRADLAGVQPLIPVPAGAWRRMGQTEEHYFWKTGHLVVDHPESEWVKGDGHKDRYFNIRFDPESFSGRAPATSPQEAPLPEPQKGLPLPAPQTPQPNRGGRPRYDYWEDLLLEMFDQLWHGTLVPKRQSDVEDAMFKWLTDNDHQHSERSVRQRAQRLWKVWIKEGNN